MNFQEHVLPNMKCKTKKVLPAVASCCPEAEGERQETPEDSDRPKLAYTAFDMKDVEDEHLTLRLKTGT